MALAQQIKRYVVGIQTLASSLGENSGLGYNAMDNRGLERGLGHIFLSCEPGYARRHLVTAHLILLPQNPICLLAKNIVQ
jgi:hypothetical protein